VSKVLCSYGADGSTDDHKPQCPVGEGPCVPGCGNPPWFCDPGSDWNHCGFEGAESPAIRPFAPADLNVMLTQHAYYGNGYSGIGNFKGCARHRGFAQ
jgi:hypothetical protein